MQTVCNSIANNLQLSNHIYLNPQKQAGKDSDFMASSLHAKINRHSDKRAWI
jgi:hypothetical protein